MKKLFLKTSLLICLLAFLSLQSFALDTEETKIKFVTGTWEEALAQAKRANKLLFVDAYATWCGPCKMMDKNTFTDAEVAKYFNTNFISYKIDVDTEEGGEVSEDYSVEAMPTYLFVNGEGKLVFKKVGYMEAKEFIEVGKTALEIPNMKKKFEEGERSTEFIKKYLLAMADTGDEDLQALADEYFKNLDESELLKEDNFELMMGYAADYDSRAFQYFLNNVEKFEEEFGEGTLYYVDNIFQILFNTTVFVLISSRVCHYSGLFN